MPGLGRHWGHAGTPPSLVKQFSFALDWFSRRRAGAAVCCFTGGGRWQRQRTPLRPLPRPCPGPCGSTAARGQGQWALSHSGPDAVGPGPREPRGTQWRPCWAGTRGLEKLLLGGSGPPDRHGALQASAAVGTRAPGLKAGCIPNPKERKEQVPVPRRGPGARSLPGVRTWSRLPRGDLGRVRRLRLRNWPPWAPAAALLLWRQQDSVPGVPRTPSALTV